MSAPRAAPVVVLAALLASCSLWSADDAPQPAAIIVAPGQRFTIELEANRSTGFQWEIGKDLDDDVLTLVDTRYEEKPGAAVGAVGTEVWTFDAVAPGWAKIDFVYRRPWEENIAPARLAFYSVDVR